MKKQTICRVDLIWLALAMLVVYGFINGQNILTGLQILLFLTILSGWTVSLSGRIVHKQVRFLFMGCGCLLIFWYSLRCLKYEFVDSIHIRRFLWYLYYLPLLFLPCAFFQICMLLGRSEEDRLPKISYWIYAPSILLLILVLTNDLHQLVFSFNLPPPFSDHMYDRGIGFALCAGWIGLCLLLSLIMMALRTGVPMMHRVVWVPWIPILSMFVYCIVYSLWGPLLNRPFRDITWVLCVLSMTLLECCIRTGLIPANMYHLQLFGASPFPALITDPDCSRFVSSCVPLDLEAKQVPAICSAGMVRQDHFRIHGAAIHDGYVIWQEDVQEIQSLLNQLQQTNAALSEENDLLEAENALRQRHIQSVEQHRLYDLLIQQIYPCLEEMEHLLDQTDRASLVRLVFLGTYAKRRSNLFLLGQERTVCSCQELEFCLQESAESLQAAGIDCSVRCPSGQEISCQQAAELYDAFQTIVQPLLSGLQTLFVSVALDPAISMTILADLLPSTPLPDLSMPGLSLSAEEGTLTCRLVMERSRHAPD